jgi:hypothetical protein
MVGESWSERIPAREAARLFRDSQWAVEKLSRNLSTEPEGWFRAGYNPGRVLNHLPHLRLRDGYRLAAYRYVAGDNGHGVTVALPEDAPLPEPPTRDEDVGYGFGNPFHAGFDDVKPQGVDPDVGKYLEGDGSPASYYEASIAVRCLQELGAVWHGRRWCTHSLLTEAPVDKDYDWKEARPEDWRPLVRSDGDTVTVRFYTASELGMAGIYRHCDTFRETYSFSNRDEVAADGGPGFLY